MANQKTIGANAFTTTATAEFASGGTVLNVATTEGLPATTDAGFYLVLNVVSTSLREYFQVPQGATITGTTIDIVTTANRNLTGTATGGPFTHPIGSTVSLVTAAQYLQDIHDRVDRIEASVVVSATQPVAPEANDLWVDTVAVGGVYTGDFDFTGDVDLQGTLGNVTPVTDDIAAHDGTRFVPKSFAELDLDTVTAATAREATVLADAATAGDAAYLPAGADKSGDIWNGTDPVLSRTHLRGYLAGHRKGDDYFVWRLITDAVADQPWRLQGFGRGKSFIATAIRAEGGIAPGWTYNGAQPLATFGENFRADTTSFVARWTSPEDTTALGIRHAKISNGGVARISINGDATAATLLPTAQELVTAGTLAASALVSGGGPLATTDRVLDTYNGATFWDAPIPIAEGLAPGKHTILVEPVAKAHTSSSGTRVYLAGWLHHTEGLVAGSPSRKLSQSRVDESAGIETGTWITSANAAAFGGDVRYSVTAGDTNVWAVPAGTNRVGVIIPRGISNAGIARVSIDGSTTAANLLPTAQELVNAGRLGSLGSLSATDRILDIHAGGTGTVYNTVVWVADVDQSDTPHTVTFESVGVTPTGSSGARAYIEGFAYRGETRTVLGRDPEVVSIESFATGSAHEYAFSVAGAIAADPFIGNAHGRDTPIGSPQPNLNGAAVTLEVGDCITGSTVELSRASTLSHPDTAATLGVVTMSYRPTDGGLVVAYRVAWSASATLAVAYPGMLPLLAGFDKATADRHASTLTLTADNDTSTVLGPSVSLASWQSSGAWAVGVGVLDVASTLGLPISDEAFWQDRTDTLNKGYFKRSTNEAVTGASVWYSRLVYRLARLAEPAVTLGK